MLGLPFLTAVTTAMISLLLTPKYEAWTSFVPETQSRGTSIPVGFGNLASQFGLALGGGGASSPRFYAEVLKSRTLRDQLLGTRFAMPLPAAPTDSASLLDILEIHDPIETTQLRAGRLWLGGATTIRVENATSIVTVRVESRSATVAAQVANMFVSLLNQFNLETRQSGAQDRRRFIEERVSGAEGELRDAEDQLQVFLEQNRQFQGSPELNFQYERLQRQVAIKQEVLTTLRRSYEEARIQEVNDAPVITVIDKAVPPDVRSSPKRRRMVLVGFVLGGLLAVLGAFALENIQRSLSDKEGNLATALGPIKTKLRAWFRPRRRAAGGV